MRYCLLAACIFFSSFTLGLEDPHYFDVVVYGGSSAGVIAAIQCARMGKSVILISQGKHLGGMTSNGICVVDVTDPDLIGGLTNKFFHEVWSYYRDKRHWIWEKPHLIHDQLNKRSQHMNTMWVLEPHIAEQIFCNMLEEAEVPYILEERLERKRGVQKRGATIVQIAMESGRVFLGKMFVDATYEGDLMAAAGVSYIVGREPRCKYNEELNGIRPNPYFPMCIDPYIIPKNLSSGLLPLIFPNEEERRGEGDAGVQAYNYRMCLTDIPENGVRINKPLNYDESNYEILFRAVNASKKTIPFFKVNYIPNRKIDANHSGPISTDYIGMSWDYSEANYATREKIAFEHRMWQQGLLWTLQNHPRIPKEVRDFYAPYALAKDEFVDNDNWPYELYVREARRMVSDYIITEHTALGKEYSKNSIGLAYYPIDCHAVKYYVNDQGHLKKEGGIFTKLPHPFPISYDAIVPKKKECQNLVVPICLSATHVAFGSIRMEPVFMILGQSAATAVCLALENGIAVQEVRYKLLHERLLHDGQILFLK